ncbi:hypothetical protein GQ42DRAFT_160764 [Ramicandelaber brevisporus]|nr:hypothetical protein GQ42DRAFT_160764 [Ramicandelaber brevisporus]
MAERKILLMGRSGVGKTAMRNVIFHNSPVHDTFRIGPTAGVELSTSRFLGQATMSLYDCGGQSNYQSEYFQAQRSQLFRGVSLLIFVFDAGASQNDFYEEQQFFRSAYHSVRTYSSSPSIFCMMNRSDLVLDVQERFQKAEERWTFVKEAVNESNKGKTLTGFEGVGYYDQNSHVKVDDLFVTTVWDNSIVRAWTAMIKSLLPDQPRIRQCFKQFLDATGADEVALFDTRSFLLSLAVASDNPPSKFSNVADLYADSRPTVTATTHDDEHAERDAVNAEEISMARREVSAGDLAMDGTQTVLAGARYSKISEVLKAFTRMSEDGLVHLPDTSDDHAVHPAAAPQHPATELVLPVAGTSAAPALQQSAGSNLTAWLRIELQFNGAKLLLKSVSQAQVTLMAIVSDPSFSTEAIRANMDIIARQIPELEATVSAR